MPRCVIDSADYRDHRENGHSLDVVGLPIFSMECIGSGIEH